MNFPGDLSELIEHLATPTSSRHLFDVLGYWIYTCHPTWLCKPCPASVIITNNNNNNNDNNNKPWAPHVIEVNPWAGTLVLPLRKDINITLTKRAHSPTSSLQPALVISHKNNSATSMIHLEPDNNTRTLPTIKHALLEAFANDDVSSTLQFHDLPAANAEIRRLRASLGEAEARAGLLHTFALFRN